MRYRTVPNIRNSREEVAKGVRWNTNRKNGCVDIDENGKIISPEERMEIVLKA